MAARAENARVATISNRTKNCAGIGSCMRQNTGGNAILKSRGSKASFAFLIGTTGVAMSGDAARKSACVTFR